MKPTTRRLPKKAPAKKHPGHRTLATEMLRVPSEFADALRSTAAELGVTAADIIRSVCLDAIASAHLNYTVK